MNTNLILESLESCLQILRRIPDNTPNKAEIEKVLAALDAARDLARQQFAQIILGGLFALGYSPDHVLFRVTTEDFADLLADYMAERNVIPADLTPDELENLISTTFDHLNGEGMPWADVVKIALGDAWPERLKGGNA